MKLVKHVSLLSAAVLASSMVMAQPQQSPEEAAVEYRQGVFETLKWKMGQLVGAKMKGDQATFQKHATDMQYLSGLIPEGFIPNSLVEGSKARPAVWEDMADFKERAQRLTTMAGELAADGYDMAEFDPRNFGRTACGGCHKDYKERD